MKEELTGLIGILREGLQKGFPSHMRFAMFLREQLDKPLANYTSPADSLPETIFRVIEQAQAEGWLKAMVLAAYRTRPNQPLIVKVANELGLGIFCGTLSNKRPLAGGARELSVVAEFHSILNSALAAIFARKIGMSGEKCRDLGLYRLRQKLARALAQNIGERIGDVSGLA